MSSQGFKNLMKISLFSDDSFQPLLKKNEEYRKVTQLSIDHFQSIVKNFQSFEGSYSKYLKQYQSQTDGIEEVIPQYYTEYIQLFRNMYSQQKMFCDKLSNNFRELTSLCNNIFSNYSNLILTFQGLIRTYKSHEQILFQLSKKYFRTHKAMLSNIQSYKNSFTDVKLIYNMDQKNKRFNACQGTFKNLNEELEAIEEKLKQINQQKQQIVKSYQEIQKQFKITLKTIGYKLIAVAKIFMHDFCSMEKTIISYLAQKKFTIEKLELKPFFNFMALAKQQQDNFSIPIDVIKCEYLPSFIIYSNQIKDEACQNIGKLINSYIKDLQVKINQRITLNKKILDFTQNFLRIYEKNFYSTFKDIMANYQKIKKRLSQIFGNRLTSFLKSTNSVFDISIGINQKMIKRSPGKVKILQNLLNEQSKTLDIFIKQLKTNIDKFLKKKDIRKIIQGYDDNQFTQQQPSNIDLTAFKKQFTQYMQYLSHLIQGFIEKIKKNQDQVKLQYYNFINDISVSTNQIYSLCCQYKQLYFGEADFKNNFSKYEVDIQKTLQNESKFFEEINFGVLIKQQSAKITFDSQMNKVDQYRKIRKPQQIQIQQQNKQSQQIQKKDIVSEAQQNASERKNSGQKVMLTEPGSPQKAERIEKQQKGQKSDNKYEQFLLTKIAFLPQQKFYKSFSCGLSDKIILTGRLFITNKRLCFHSKFNPNTVFFGDTFMQIPRKDIKKIQKRLNAIVFDNSISITTIHGQVFFTSFFSRNEAYDLICSALDINSDEVMFEPQEIKQQPNVEIKIVDEIDDIKDDDLQQRKQAIELLQPVYNYKQIFKSQIVYPGLNAFKFFKLFQLGQQFTYNRKNYKSWAVYFKDLLQHKDYSISDWTPSVAQYLNSGNIKANTPHIFNKKINCLVPVPPSGVPFMPKHTKSQQIVNLYLYSKDKFVIQSTIQNSGVPYADTFNLKIKKIFESQGPDKCVLTVFLFINFHTSTMMKSIIESKSTEQAKGSFSRYDEQVKKYLKYVDKMKLKQMKSENISSDRQNKQNGLNEQYEKQLNEVRQQQQKLKQQLKRNKLQLQQGKKILLGSIILNILLILILIA